MSTASSDVQSTTRSRKPRDRNNERHRWRTLRAAVLALTILLGACEHETYRLVPQPILVYRTVEVPQILSVGKLSWPIPEHVVTSPKGKRSDLKRTATGGGDSLHNGIDIVPSDRSKIHSLIQASYDGTVVATFTARHPNKTYGICTVIKSDLGWRWPDGSVVYIYTTYAHLSELWVGQGETVERGAFVGRMGKTGDAEGYHLHFEVTLDPMDFLAD